MTLKNHDVRKSLTKLKAEVAPSRSSTFRKVHIPMKKDTYTSDGASKRLLIETYASQTEKLQQKQTQYRKLLIANEHTHKIVKASGETHFQRANTLLRAHKNDLKARLWVSDNINYRHKTKKELSCIKSQATCQERLLDDIQSFRSEIRHLEHQISGQDKRIFSLKCVALTDIRHKSVVIEAKKKLRNFENHLEMKIGRECHYTTENNTLRNELIQLLNDRTIYNEMYTKLVQQLTSDKKYLFEIIDYAMRIFDSCIDTYDKMEHCLKKERRDREQLKEEYQNLIYKRASADRLRRFVDLKNNEIKLADLEPREIKRRQNYVQTNLKKYARYTHVFDKLCMFTGENLMSGIIDKFKEQESLYYSYFTYANEMGYHMTLLNSACNNLFEDIRNLRHDIRDTQRDQIQTIIDLEKVLLDKRRNNDQLQISCDKLENHLETLFQDIGFIYELTQLDPAPLMLLFNDRVVVDMRSMRLFLKKLENRLMDIIAYVYCIEREPINKIETSSVDYDDETRSAVVATKRTIRAIEKLCDWPSTLSDVVLTQQCPECAAGDAFIGAEDGNNEDYPETSNETRQRLYDKVVQPEMQYRLHPITECRLPRSRAIAAKMEIQ